MPPFAGDKTMYSETTHAIEVTVEPFFLEDESSPPDHRFVWAYHVCIANNSVETVQLLRRHKESRRREPGPGRRYAWSPNR